jgi:hypothetical protein
MKIFFSWSRKRSKEVATAFSNWIEQVLQMSEPWLSTEIEKGKRWDAAIANKLEESKVGIICLTSENIKAEWILFEAGAISKNTDAHMCTFLLDLKPSDITPPLSLFQATLFTKEDIWKLILTINSKISQNGEKSLPESKLQSVFQTFWPQLESILTNIKSEQVPSGSIKNKATERSDREILEEALQILRSIDKKKSVVTSLELSLSDIQTLIGVFVELFIARHYKGIYPSAEKILIHEDDIYKYVNYHPMIRKVLMSENDIRTTIRKYITEEYLPF